jgi:tRNA C32,U32 (ribose-2'-O)-methylase TrmJ
MAIRNVALTNSFEEWRVETNEIASDAGDVLTLTTVATNLTDGINEQELKITTNATNITTNATNITTNATNITLKEDIGVAVAMAIALGG